LAQLIKLITATFLLLSHRINTAKIWITVQKEDGDFVLVEERDSLENSLQLVELFLKERLVWQIYRVHNININYKTVDEALTEIYLSNIFEKLLEKEYLANQSSSLKKTLCLYLMGHEINDISRLEKKAEELLFALEIPQNLIQESLKNTINKNLALCNLLFERV